MRWLGVIALAAACGGCASITRGTTDQVQIQSEPSGAEVRTSMNQVCTTPCTLQFSRKDEFTVKFDADGYDPQEIQVKTGIAGAGAAGFAGNVILGGVVGMAADAATGATLEHIPNPVHADLQPAAVAPTGTQGRGKPPRKASPKPAPEESQA